MRAVVVGGGIGGLAAGIGLVRAGWDVSVLERAAAATALGAGISLWPNALTALDALGVWPDIRRAAAMELGGVRRADGRWLARLDDTPSPVEILLVHRAQLRDQLVGALGPDLLETGVEVQAISPDGAVHTDRGVEHADLVVAADGVHSACRAQLWPEHPGERYAGFTAWRGVTTSPVELRGGAETLGRGAEFGATIMLDGRSYWYATANTPEGARAPDERAEVLHRFRDWHAPIGDIVRATAPDAVLRHDIYSLPTPLPPFASGRVALLGDAAHAMTPNLGQGGCQALEDAVTLCALLADGDVDAALRRYDELRRPRAEWFVKTSARVARSYQTENRLAVAARDLAVRVVPPGLAARAIARRLAWTPPS